MLHCLMPRKRLEGGQRSCTPAHSSEVQHTTLQVCRDNRILLQDRICKVQPLAAVLCMRHLVWASYPRHRPRQAGQKRHRQNQHWGLACFCIRSISFRDTTAVIRMSWQKWNCASSCGDVQVGWYISAAMSSSLTQD